MRALPPNHPAAGNAGAGLQQAIGRHWRRRARAGVLATATDDIFETVDGNQNQKVTQQHK
jgi:hypothetical protein